jgi:hypothetical protein
MAGHVTELEAGKADRRQDEQGVQHCIRNRLRVSLYRCNILGFVV